MCIGSIRVIILFCVGCDNGAVLGIQTQDHKTLLKDCSARC